MSKLKCENGNIKVGDYVNIATQYCRLVGVVVSVSEYFKDGGVAKIYQIAISKTICLSINSDEIVSINVYEDNEKEVIDMMSSKYGIACRDKDGNLKETMPLLHELITDNTWTKMSQEDKELFLSLFRDIDNTTAIDGWNGCYHKQNELHQKIKKLTEENATLRKMLMESKKKNSNTVADEMVAALALIGIGGALCAVADNL